jgi:hypothetical protein
MLRADFISLQPGRKFYEEFRHRVWYARTILDGQVVIRLAELEHSFEGPTLPLGKKTGHRFRVSLFIPGERSRTRGKQLLVSVVFELSAAV